MAVPQSPNNPKVPTVADIKTTETMRVTIRDRAAESPWGSGLTNPAVRSVEISAYCPKCGGERGKPTSTRQHEDGVTYYVDTWDNSCGHIDQYAAVAKEAAMAEGVEHG